MRNMEGSPIRRIGHERWLRNLAVGLGNAAENGNESGDDSGKESGADRVANNARSAPDIVAALTARLQHASPLVREHVEWALARHR